MPDSMVVTDVPNDHQYVRSTVLQTIALRSFEKKRSILIEAQAGQGKTTLARQYLAQVGTAGLWYPLSPEDNDAVVLIDRLHRLLKGSVKHFSSRLIATMLAKGEISYQAMGKYARILLSDLKKSLRQDLYLVFDDIHLIEKSPASLKFLEAFAAEPGQGLYFILISRRRIPRQVRARFQSGHCIYLDSQTLAFSKKETREFVHRCMELPLSRKQLNQLYETTNGWIMGLKSKCFTLKNRGRSQLGAGEPLQGDAELDFHYFAEEVYPFMAPEVSEPMLKLALLEDIPLQLARQISNDTAIADKLSYLYRDNFFLSRWGDKGDSFSFHHLFRDFLRVKCAQRFPKEEIADFLNRAGWWYETQNEIEKALSCFLKAENHDEMEAFLERRGLEVYRSGHLYCVHLLLKKVPPPVRETRCWTSFFLGLLSVELDPASALPCLHTARSLFASQGNRQGELLATAEICFHHIFIDGRLKSGKALFPRATELFNELRESLAPFYLARTASSLATCHFYYFGDTEKAEAYTLLVKETARSHDMRSILAESHTTSCLNHMGRGKFSRSAKELDAQFRYLSDPRVTDSTKFLACLTQLNHLEITGDFVNYTYMKSVVQRLAGTEIIQSTVLRDFTTVWDTCQALADGDTDHALRLINDALGRDEAGQSPHLRSQFYHYLAFLQGVKKNPEKALEAAEMSLALRRKAQAPYFETLQAMILGGMYAQLEMHEKAEEFLARAISGSETLREGFIRCGALSQRACMNLQRGETEPALKDTRELLALMEKERYLHFDSWVPHLMLPLLRFAHEQGISPDYVRMLAAKRLNVSFDADHRALPLLEITTLGRFTLRLQGRVILDGTQLTHNEQRLLTAILCSTSRSIGIHEAVHILWPESPEKKAMKSLNVMLFRLRKKVSRPDLSPAFDFQDYLQHKNKQLFLAHCRVDAYEFQASAEKGLTQAAHDLAWQASNSFRKALSLWKGPFLKSIACDDTAGEFNDRFFLNILSQAATRWSAVIKKHGDYIREDLDLIEDTIPRGAGTPEMMTNLLDIHAASGDNKKIHRLTAAYEEALVKAGFSPEEIEEELEGIWVQAPRPQHSAQEK